MSKPKVLYPYTKLNKEIPKNNLPEFEEFAKLVEIVYYELTTLEAFKRDLQTNLSDISAIWGNGALVSIGSFDELIDYFPSSLQILSYPWVGSNYWHPEKLKERGIILTNVGDGSANEVADIALLLTLGTFRFTSFFESKFREVGHSLKARAYINSSIKDPKTGELLPSTTEFDSTKGVFINGKNVASPYGKVAGIIGLGAIGKKIAIRLNAIGLKIKYNKRSPLTPKEKDQFDFDLEYIESIDELISQVDLLLLCVPHTPTTINIINKDSIKLLKKGARIVNVGRGTAIDEDVLLKALDDGTVTSFGADVFQNEPTIDERFLNRPDVVIQPHLGPFTTDQFDTSIIKMIDNIKDVLLDGGDGLHVAN